MPNHKLLCRTCGALYTVDGPPTLDLGSVTKSCGCPYVMGEMVALPVQEADGRLQWEAFCGMASGAAFVSGRNVWATTDGARFWLWSEHDNRDSPRVLRDGLRTIPDVAVAFRWMWDQFTEVPADA